MSLHQNSSWKIRPLATISLSWDPKLICINVENALFNKTRGVCSWYVKVYKTLLELIDNWHKMLEDIVLTQKKIVIFIFLLT